MIKFVFALLNLCIVTSVWAVPTDAVLAQVTQQVVKVNVALKAVKQAQALAL